MFYPTSFGSLSVFGTNFMPIIRWSSQLFMSNHWGFIFSDDHLPAPPPAKVLFISVDSYPALPTAGHHSH